MATLRKRAVEIVKALRELQYDSRLGKLHMGQLLLEFDEGQYYEDFGFHSFNAWVGASSGWLKPRKALYLRRIALVLRELKYKPEQVADLGIARLRLITALGPQHAREIKELLKSDKVPFSSVRTAVKSVLGEPDYSTVSFSLPTSLQQFTMAVVKETAARYGCSQAEAFEIIIRFWHKNGNLKKLPSKAVAA